MWLWVGLVSKAQARPLDSLFLLPMDQDVELSSTSLIQYLPVYQHAPRHNKNGLNLRNYKISPVKYYLISIAVAMVCLHDNRTLTKTLMIFNSMLCEP